MTGPRASHPDVAPALDGVLPLPPAPLQAPPMERLRSHTDWRRDWIHIVAGRFSGSTREAILLYDQAAGFGAYHDTDGHGDRFGRHDGLLSVVGNETDAVAPDSPSSFHRLATVTDVEIATMGRFSPIDGFDTMRGIVFDAATMNWTLGLSQADQWNPMDVITRNVLIRLG